MNIQILSNFLVLHRQDATSSPGQYLNRLARLNGNLTLVFKSGLLARVSTLLGALDGALTKISLPKDLNQSF